MKWILLLAYSVLVVGCAYATGNAMIHLMIDRKLDIDSTINQDRNKQVRQLPQATPSTGDKQE